MGLVCTNIILSNTQTTKLKPIEVQCLVDTGATYLCIPEELSLQLQLVELKKREVILADGSVKIVPYVGHVKVSFENRSCFIGAMVMGDTPLLGVITYGRYRFGCASETIQTNR